MSTTAFRPSGPLCCPTAQVHFSWVRRLLRSTAAALTESAHVPGRTQDYDTCVLVTHGLTIRLLLMAIFHWSVWTFETVYNIGNCHHITLKKNMDTCCYELCPAESFPPRWPWATRKVWVRFKSVQACASTQQRLKALAALRQTASALDQDSGPDSQHEGKAGSLSHSSSWTELDRVLDTLSMKESLECSKPYTVLDYLTLRPPRTMQKAEILRRLLPGHRVRGTPEELMKEARAQPRIDPDDVVWLDWWGESLSHRNKMLHITMDNPELAGDLDITPGGRVPTVPSVQEDTWGSADDEDDDEESEPQRNF